jgi:hypothetical protein
MCVCVSEEHGENVGTVSVNLYHSLHCYLECPDSSDVTSFQSRPRTSEVLGWRMVSLYKL